MVPVKAELYPGLTPFILNDVRENISNHGDYLLSKIICLRLTSSENTDYSMGLNSFAEIRVGIKLNYLLDSRLSINLGS